MYFKADQTYFNNLGGLNLDRCMGQGNACFDLEMLVLAEFLQAAAAKPMPCDSIILYRANTTAFKNAYSIMKINSSMLPLRNSESEFQITVVSKAAKVENLRLFLTYSTLCF